MNTVVMGEVGMEPEAQEASCNNNNNNTLHGMYIYTQ